MNNGGIYDTVIQEYHKLTKSEMRIADYILTHKSDVPFIMSRDLAEGCQVSEATITRFSHSVGCASFNDLKVRAAQSVSAEQGAAKNENNDVYGDIESGDSVEQKSLKLYKVGISALQQTYEMLNYNAISEVADLLYQADSVYCFGQGNSSIIAMDAWGRFASVTHKFHWVSGFHMQAITAATLGKKDVVLYFSFSGAMPELSELGKQMQGSEAKLVLITRFPNSPGTKNADFVIICGADEAPNQQGSIAVKLGQLFIIDVLYHEYCSRDPVATEENRVRTLNAISPMLLAD